MSRRVRLKDMPGGLWKVVAIDGAWVGVKALDDRAREIATIANHGVVWFKKQDTLTDTPETETLL